MTIIQLYAPTEASEDEEKDEFYSKLQDAINNIPIAMTSRSGWGTSMPSLKYSDKGVK